MQVPAARCTSRAGARYQQHPKLCDKAVLVLESGRTMIDLDSAGQHTEPVAYLVHTIANYLLLAPGPCLLVVDIFPHITMWGSSFSLCNRRSASSRRCRRRLRLRRRLTLSSYTPLNSHHLSHTTHLTPLILHQLTPPILHHLSHTTHLTPLILHHSTHTTYLTPPILHYGEPGVQILWQAQYTEPPGSAAACVGAAGPRVAEYRFRGRRSAW